MRLSGTQARSISSSRGLGNTLWDLAGNRPSLDLRFAESKSLVDATTGTNLVDFTRASSGTYVGSDGLIKTATINEPRFDHDPTTGESLGLLVEEQRTNLLLRSEEFDNASWTASNVSLSANSIQGPADTATAGKVIEAATSTDHSLRQAANAAATTTYTGSVWAKAAERTLVGFWIRGASSGNRVQAQFDLSNGTIATAASAIGLFTGPSAAITAFPGGWYRCTLTGTTGAGETSVQFQVFINTTVGQISTAYAGDGTSGVYLWGAQLEAGSFPTSYIPTEGSAVTRAADVASISGSNFSSWYRQSEGTVYWEGNTFASTETGHFGVQDASSTGFVRLSRAFNQARSIVAVSSVNQADIYSGNAMTLGANNKIATALKANDFALSLAGGTVVADTSGTMPTVDRATIGRGAFLSQLNGTIRRLAYFPTRLPNETLQAITQ